MGFWFFYLEQADGHCQIIWSCQGPGLTRESRLHPHAQNQLQGTNHSYEDEPSNSILLKSSQNMNLTRCFSPLPDLHACKFLDLFIEIVTHRGALQGVK